MRELPAWTEDDARRFLAAIRDHRWYGPIRLDVLYDLRPSELLGLKATTVRVERGLAEVGGVPTHEENGLVSRADPSERNVAGWCVPQAANGPQVSSNDPGSWLLPLRSPPGVARELTH